MQELPKRKRKLTLPDSQISKVPRLEEDMEVEETLGKEIIFIFKLRSSLILLMCDL